ncbi:hypothetical protein Taro_049027 [Colocasia esculenta]|uniref:Ubiquitin-like protease family profile domain-containing protein n=1 Tax=Colocasia esculenta TaxID=4460 RepID=A0A843X9U0_COLES|nr:hypothetical protein [Colocasia esculenta]
MASCRSPTSDEIGRIAADAEQQALMAMEVDETSLQVIRNLATIMGIPNNGSPINLKAYGTKASLRRILGCKKMMNKHNILQKLTEYVPQEDELAVEISVKLWFALLYSSFFFPISGRSGLLSILPYLDDLHEMKNANWAAAIHEYLILAVQQCQEHVKAYVTGAAFGKTTFLTGCVPALSVYLEVNVRDELPKVLRQLTASTSTSSRTPPSATHVVGILQELLRVSKQQREVIELQSDLLQRQTNILQSMDQRLHRLEEQFERQPQWQHPLTEPQYAVLTFLTCSDLMFDGTLEGYDNFLSFKDIRNLLFTRESEPVIIDCYVNTCLFLPRQENPYIFKTFGYLGAALKGYVQLSRDDKSKKQHFDYSFRRLDRAPTEFDLLFSPMHVGTNHWALLVININEKEFHVYDSLRNKDRRDIPQYVEELRTYMKGNHIDSENWFLCYPDPCPQ